jgi:hypothetical protein
MFQYYLGSICDATNLHAISKIGTSLEQVCDHLVISWGSSHLLILFGYGLCTQIFSLLFIVILYSIELFGFFAFYSDIPNINAILSVSKT